MREDFEKLFAGLREFEIPPGLYERIAARIEYEKMRIARIRLILFSGAVFGSCIVLIPAFRYAAQDFYQSGFYQYFSLLLSDRAIVMTYWKDFVMSLAESLPFFSATAMLTLFFAFLGSLKYMTRDIKIVFLSTRAS